MRRPARPAWPAAAAVAVTLAASSLLPDAAARPADAPRTVRLSVRAPDRIEQQPTVWAVAFGSVRPHPDPEPAGHTGQVTARIRTGGSVVRDVTVTVDGPGTLVAAGPTRFTRLEPDASVPVAWRWAAPLRTGPPPYDLRFTVRVAYTTSDGRRTVHAADRLRVRPPDPPEGDAFVSDLPFSHVTAGYGPVERDRNNGGLRPGDGGPLRLDGVEYAEGIGTHARSVIGLHLDGRCSRFTAVVGVDDVKGPLGSVAFRVRGDGRTLYDSGTRTGAAPAERVSVDVTGVTALELVSDPTADGQAHDWADWAGAALVC